MSKEPTVKVHLLDGGSFSTADISLLHAEDVSSTFRMYDWCFHIHHAASNTHLLWDLGISSDETAYTPFVQQYQIPHARPVGPRKPLANQLAEINVQVSDIKTVIFSHAHWDHSRPISKEFPQATAIFGPGTTENCAPGHLEVEGAQWDSRFFGTSSRTERVEELEPSPKWKAWGPFDRALDYFGDGSFMILDAPGHMPGNLAAAARIEGTKGEEWIVLASDCCHSRELLDGKKQVAFFPGPGGKKMCLHTDLEAARDTMRRLNVAEREMGMHVAMAHDVEWMKTGQDEVLMSLLLPSMHGEWLDRVRTGLAP